MPNSRTTTLYSVTRRPYTQRSNQQIDSSICNASSRSEAKSSVQPIQRKIEESDPQHVERGVLRNVSSLLKFSASLFDILDDRYLVLHMQNLPVSHRENETNEPGRFDTLSFPQNVIKKGPLHGARHGNTENEFITQLTLRPKVRRERDIYQSILDRFQTCPIYRVTARDWMGRSLLRTLTKLSNEDHTYVCIAEEHQRRECAVQEPEDHKRLILKSQGQNGPMKQREDYAEPVKIKKRLYKESGGARPKIHPSKQVRQRANQPFARSSEGAERVDPKTGWKWYPSTASSSSSSSWWQSSDKWWHASTWDEQ